jgi:hypothetical protein
MVNEYVFKTTFNFNTPLIKMVQEDNTLNEEKVGVILINSVSLYPLYLIPILINHPRTNSKKRLCALCVETDTNQSKSQKTSTNKNPIIQQSTIL